MSSEPPRRPPYQPPAGSGGGGFYRHPVKPTKKRPRDTVADRDGAEADASAAAAAAANAPPPPNLRQLRRDNAQRWEEVVRLRERLAQRESERRRRGGDLPAPAQAAAAAEHGPIIGEEQQQEVENNRNIDRLGPLDRRLAAHRAELALLVQQQEPQGQAAAGEQQQQQQQQQQQDERNVRSIQAHRSMIQNACLHQAQLFGNEIIETYDGLAQLHAHLDRTIGVPPRDNNNNAGADVDEEGNAADAAAAAANADNDERVDGGMVAQDRAVLTLYDRIAEAEARVEEHRVIHTALMDMLQRRRSNDDAQETSQDNHDGADGVAATATAATNAAATARIVAVGQPIRSNTDAAVEEAQRIHAEMVYFAQRFDAHMDRMEQVAATAAREEREGDTLSDDEDNGGDDTEGGANGAAGRAGTGDNNNNNNNRARPSSSTSSSSSQNPFLATLFVDLARRMVSNREDPYVSVEAIIGAAAGASSSSSSRQRWIERRRRIVDHLLACGVLVRHTDNADLICFNYFE